MSQTLFEHFFKMADNQHDFTKFKLFYSLQTCSCETQFILHFIGHLLSSYICTIAIFLVLCGKVSF